MTQSFKTESRKDWFRAGDNTATNEEIQLGCLQRIADASESMERRHTELIDENRRLQKSVDNWKSEAMRLRRTISAQKGVITKLTTRLGSTHETN